LVKEGGLGDWGMTHFFQMGQLKSLYLAPLWRVNTGIGIAARFWGGELSQNCDDFFK
jgi:hypothetical protein